MVKSTHTHHPTPTTNTSDLETLTTTPPGSAPAPDEACLSPNLITDSQNPFLATSGVIDGASDGSPLDSFMRQYQTQQDTRIAGFVFPNHQWMLWQHLQDQEEVGRPYAPWSSKEEWALIYWLSMAQLS